MLTVRITGATPGQDGETRVVDVTQQGAWLIMACGTTTPAGENREAVSGNVFLHGEIGAAELTLLMAGMIEAAGAERVARAFGKAIAKNYEEESGPC